MAGDPPAVVPHPDWVIYKQSPALVLGFHGCDRSTAEDILCGRKRHLQHSSNEYDWLGSGIYFWEADPWRAWAFAKEVRDNPKLSRGKIDDPCVIGAVLDLGHCCNLLDYEVVGELQAAYSFTGTSEVVNSFKTELALNAGRGAKALPRQRTDCHSTDGLVAPSACCACGADPDANRSAGLHSNLVDLTSRRPPRVSRACPLPV